MNVQTDHTLERAVAQLLERAGIVAGVERLTPISSGGNNRSYCVETSHGRFAAKHYFQNDGDTRDRLKTEYDFLQYAVSADIEAVPRPLSVDSVFGIALYEYIDGTPFSAGEIGQAEVEAAIRFLQALNGPNALSAGKALAPASEAAFSIREHLDNTDRRVRQLLNMQPVDEIDRKALEFIQLLEKKWGDYRESVLNDVSESTGDIDLPFQRCVSPSDFGFHNAIRTPHGEIRFIDFEYAGWDDPAKTIADFFSQPAVPVPLTYRDEFESSVAGLFDDPEVLIRRTRLLWPAYEFKWCCIALNVFLPVHMERRKFANPQLDANALKSEQLSKARALFKTIKCDTA